MCCAQTSQRCVPITRSYWGSLPPPRRVVHIHDGLCGRGGDTHMCPIMSAMAARYRYAGRDLSAIALQGAAVHSRWRSHRLRPCRRLGAVPAARLPGAHAAAKRLHEVSKGRPGTDGVSSAEVRLKCRMENGSTQGGLSTDQAMPKSDLYFGAGSVTKEGREGGGQIAMK